MSPIQSDHYDQDLRQQAEAYAEKYRINTILEELMAHVLYHQPDKPRQFMKSHLSKAQQNGLTQSLVCFHTYLYTRIPAAV